MRKSPPLTSLTYFTRKVSRYSSNASESTSTILSIFKIAPAYFARDRNLFSPIPKIKRRIITSSCPYFFLYYLSIASSRLFYFFAWRIFLRTTWFLSYHTISAVWLLSKIPENLPPLKGRLDLHFHLCSMTMTTQPSLFSFYYQLLSDKLRHCPNNGSHSRIFPPHESGNYRQSLTRLLITGHICY